MSAEKRRLMPITVIGSYPKPSCCHIPSWFDRMENGLPNQKEFSIETYTGWEKDISIEELEKNLEKGYKEIIEHQILCGVDIITDGELSRENYIHYHCRHLNGFDFENAELVRYREGATEGVLPKITSKVEAGAPFLVDTFQKVQNMSTAAVKVTVPGPMTVYDTCINQFYDNPSDLCWDLACAINVEIKRLIDAGCYNIQVDEPLFARQVNRAKEYGFRCLDRCLLDVDLEKVHTTVHICCGYSNELDEEEFVTAETHSYVKLAPGLDQSLFHAVSVEDARQRIPDRFFHVLQKKEIVLGSVKSCSVGFYTPEEIETRIEYILNLGVDPERLILAPDCGLAMLNNDDVYTKLNNLRIARDKIVENIEHSGE